MCREAERAGLIFDDVKMRALHCAADDADDKIHTNADDTRGIPQFAVSDYDNVDPVTMVPEQTNGQPKKKVYDSHDGIAIDDMPMFQRKVHLSAIKGRVHDVLCFRNGAGRIGVVAWNFMEYLPFRRMDLQDDGSWKPITWPLPKGEVRDIPDNVVVHNSVIRRMKADPSYRPGNLILGGGGRGIRVAPEEHGLGEWEVLREEGDLIGEVYVRRGKPIGSRTLSGHNGIFNFISEKKGSF
jgi:hypothetical protein